ncbi:sugar phosphate isomerase/epimerase family protein [Paenibacillus harenae]|uniref:sugar phosphate isomerase/epimerase family protein n=1 Tax=Paenibacillus harenae TaxID=306543 RepID=UPI0004227810|nr:TIM barrel protein [Paenibacillus harenae]
MLQTGLISVTFRQLTPEEIIKLVVQAGLQAIEWGGDIHVPPNDRKHAAKVGARTRDAGIAVASYGSYYRVGSANTGEDGLAFERVLETAEALQAPAIRVWAGDRGSAAADEQRWTQVIEDARRIAGLAQEAGISIDFEFHGGTLTDTADTAYRLLTGVNRSNVRCHWQPQTHDVAEERLRGLRRILPWLANLHVFHWLPEERRPLSDGREEWERYLKEAAETSRTHYALLEFVKDNAPEQFLKDAELLKSIIGT